MKKIQGAGLTVSSVVLMIACSGVVEGLLRVLVGEAGCDIQPHIAGRTVGAFGRARVGFDERDLLHCEFVGAHSGLTACAFFQVLARIFQGAMVDFA